ncbi:RTA1-domain-containing protein [Fomitopsis serialis]|uniref:RTA1-domain-containing protein n=1 Tax=Fomitopsis serialis TaxID=139415 RepID=UPI002007B059|nr:RTA1-domain-containing protein [Neoantrodia serialis]KAH9917421.1 RTA1-domain-containing protein [Neoantrodia serialis]
MQDPLVDIETAQVTPYGYTPTAWVGILMLVLFTLTTIIHFIQALRYRMWFLLWTVVVAGILECVGWAGRLWSAYNVLASKAYTMQIICTIIGPTPLIAANFVILGHIIRRLGQQYSRLSARWYTIIFVSCDVIALVVQALGGAAAASAVNNNHSPSGGSDIMLAGIIFQTAAITLYILCAVEFFLRYFYDKPLGGRENVKTGYLFEGKLRQMVIALIFSSLFFYVRTWYRCIELGDGWQGRIIRTERYFVIMDALMIVLAMWTLNIFHPGRLLGYGADWSADKNIVMRAVQPQDSEATIGMAWSGNRAAKEQY